MRLLALTLMLTLHMVPAFAQNQVYVENLDDGDSYTVPLTPNNAPQTTDGNTVEAVTPPPPPQYENRKFAILQTLDKVTARTSTIVLPIGTPASVGPLFIDVKTCKKTPTTELPESAAFIQVWESKPQPGAKKKDKKTASQWVFSGWMFASSPALSAINHPIYDVWLKDCTDTPPKAASK